LKDGEEINHQQKMLQRFTFKGKLYVYIWETIVRVLVFAEVTNPVPNYAQTITGKSAKGVKYQKREIMPNAATEYY